MSTELIFGFHAESEEYSSAIRNLKFCSRFCKRASAKEAPFFLIFGGDSHFFTRFADICNWEKVVRPFKQSRMKSRCEILREFPKLVYY